MAVATDKETIRANWRVFLICGLVLLSPFQYGIDFGMIGGFQAMPGFLKIYGYQMPNGKWNIDTLRQQLISSFMTLGAFVSSGLAGVIAKWLGRKACLWIACGVCCVSNIIMMATTDIGALYVGRLMIGLANGYFMTFSQLYIQESSPAKYRGLFLAVFQFCTSIGTLIGNIVDWATAGRPDASAYLIPLGLVYVIPAILAVGMFFIPESPRWLILQGRREEAHKALARLRPDGTDVAIEAEEIHASIEREREMGAGVGMIDMFKLPVDRRRTTISICVVLLQASSGSMFIIAFKQYFFSMAEVTDPFGMGCVLSAVGLVAIILNSLIIVRYGRRRVLIFSGLILCGILQLIIAVVYKQLGRSSSTGTILVALSSLYMMSYNGMIATYAWLAGGEMPSQRLRSYTFGVAAAVGFFGAWLTTFTAPYFINPQSLNWGPQYGFIWAPSCAIGAAWVFFFLPETKGRTLEEIDEMFAANLPARKFRGYTCVGRAGGAEKSSDAMVWENESGLEKVEKGTVQAVEATAVNRV